VVSRLNEMGLT